MKALGNYLLRTRVHAVLTISALTVLSIFVSPFSYFISGAPMGLAALRKGTVIGLQVAAGSLLLITLPALALNLQPGIPIAFLVSVWLPVILCSGMLRSTQSQGLMVLCAGTVGIFFMAGIYFALGHVQEWWREWFELWKQHAASGPAREQLEQAYQSISPFLPVIFGSGFVISLIITMLLARWWQSALFNPGWFQERILRVAAAPRPGIPGPGRPAGIIAPAAQQPVNRNQGLRDPDTGAVPVPGVIGRARFFIYQGALQGLAGGHVRHVFHTAPFHPVVCVLRRNCECLPGRKTGPGWR